MHMSIISGVHEIATLVANKLSPGGSVLTASNAEGSALKSFKCFAFSLRRGIYALPGKTQFLKPVRGMAEANERKNE